MKSCLCIPVYVNQDYGLGVTENERYHLLLYKGLQKEKFQIALRLGLFPFEHLIEKSFYLSPYPFQIFYKISLYFVLTCINLSDRIIAPKQNCLKDRETGVFLSPSHSKETFQNVVAN